MMRVVWTTDIHLNFLQPHERADFYVAIQNYQPDAVFISGDIAEAPSLRDLLHEMQCAIDRPFYFVLGNHDFYHASIETVRREIEDWGLTQSGLIYLSTSGLIALTPQTALIGHDGWGDGRLGNYQQSPVRLSDQALIRDFQGLDRDAVLAKLQALGEASAASLRDVLTQAVDSYQQIVCLTHVPPFKEACWYEGKVGNDDWLPYFTCHAIGEVLLEMAHAHPDCQLTVLCGHTHHAGTVQMLPNLLVKTGSAEYGQPHLEDILMIE
ncbi:MAG: metallophosphoesterase [Nitrospirota bacterium]|nr:metallophosphoesterase [Nitrospirota bacterium]MDH5773662.1 metallophosphoesterase [Nitrospirota bacterium]